MVNCIFYGLVTSVVMFGYTLLLYALGYHGEKIDQAMIPGLLSNVIFIGGLVLGIREARKEAQEEYKVFTYGAAFKTGALISVFMAIGGAVFSYIYSAFVNPGMADILMNNQYNKMLESGMPQEQIMRIQESSRVWFEPQFQAISALIGTIIIGILLTLIIAIFMRVRPRVNVVIAP